MFSENPTEHKLFHILCYFLPCCEVNHEANAFYIGQSMCSMMNSNVVVMKAANTKMTYK